ncbi:MAG: GDP-mannose 4,6-dehydratase [Candidatus Eremiobacteraeota bacterium]|nr:GDP-mannose 4,6-dehydratase [Candidatus Eremiobacteraeota bacterium]
MSAPVAATNAQSAPLSHDRLPPKTLLVTGGAGFIGSNFVRYMYERYPNYRVIVLDALTYAGDIDYFGNIALDERFAFHYGDVRNRELVDKLVAQSNVVVHFAAESHVSRSIADTASCVSTDVLGTDTVASCVVKHKAHIDRFIHISTSEVYGTAHEQYMDESHPLNPCSPYAGAKAGADRLICSYFLTYDLPVVIVRPFNNYGPHQHLEKLIPRLITSAILGERMPIHGDGSACRDWLFVEDHCAGLDAILHAPVEKVAGEVFNLGTGREASILDIATLIADKMNYDKSRFSFMTNRPGQVDLHRANVEKAAQVLGFRASTPLSDGLDKTIAWYVNNRNIWQRQLWLRHIEIETPAGKILH